MVTLRDIAEQVGVSVSAVSLVLNDRGGGRVRADVAQRIREVAAELGYIPNLLARGLKTRQSLTVGLISDRVASIPFAGQMLAGAQVAAAEEEYLLMLIDTAGDPRLEGPAVRALLQRNIEGLIIAAEFHRDVEIPLLPHSIPAVVLDGKPKIPPPGSTGLSPTRWAARTRRRGIWSRPGIAGSPSATWRTPCSSPGSCAGTVTRRLSSRPASKSTRR